MSGGCPFKAASFVLHQTTICFGECQLTVRKYYVDCYGNIYRFVKTKSPCKLIVTNLQGLYFYSKDSLYKKNIKYYFLLFCGGNFAIIPATNSLMRSCFLLRSWVSTPLPTPCQTSSFFEASIISIYKVPSVWVLTAL